MTHTERRKQTPPLPCWGVELSLSDPTCVSCPHLPSCRQVVGVRALKVPLNDAVFVLHRPERVGSDNTAENIASLYSLAYRRIFNRSAPDSVTDELQKDVTTQAASLRVTAETYVYACLLGHKTSCPERLFRSEGLVSASALKRVKFYRSKAVERFGTSDVKAVSRISGHDNKLSDEMGYSEELFGGWIVGARIDRGGNGVGALYANRETALSPYWLVTEPTYQKWRSEQRSTGTPEVQRHRRTVALIAAKSVTALIAARAARLPSALAVVLNRHSLKPFQLLSDSKVDSAFKLWLGIGDALLQLKLLKQVEKSTA